MDSECTHVHVGVWRMLLQAKSTPRLQPYVEVLLRG